MKCLQCPVDGACLGERVVRLCELAETRSDYRNLLVVRAQGATTDGGALLSMRSPLLEAVASCPSRGGVLPHRIQPECGCGELNECHEGRGLIAGRVALRDCLACVSSQTVGTKTPVNTHGPFDKPALGRNNTA
jgi:hypothetical protein